jgi:hypothetical protein
MADAPKPASQRDAQQPGRRIIIDGELWLVFELPAPPYDRRETPSLVFESEATVRRVRNYPANWRALSDTELFALSWAV